MCNVVKCKNIGKFICKFTACTQIYCVAVKLGEFWLRDVVLVTRNESKNCGKLSIDRSTYSSHANPVPWLCFQVDIFVVDSVFLGKLTSIRIGHSETKLGKLCPSTCLKVVLILVDKSVLILSFFLFRY